MDMHALNMWRQAGVLYLWRYTENVRNYPGWHLAADQLGHASLLALLNRLLTANGTGVWRTLESAAPSAGVLAIANNRRSPVVSPSRIRVAASVTADEWTIAEAESDAVMTLGAHHLEGIIRRRSDADAAFDLNYGSSPHLWFGGIVDATSAHRGIDRTR